MEIRLHAIRGPSWLEFNERAGRRSFSCTASLHIDDIERSVRLNIIEHAFRTDMLAFFEQMAAERNGWEGRKRWRSEFAELHVEAENPVGEEVTLHVRLCADEPPFEGTLTVRPDEMVRVADRMAGFLDLPKGQERLVRIRGEDDGVGQPLPQKERGGA